MTEKQLRKSLNTYLSPASLPERRKQDMLRQIRSETPPAREKGEPNMIRPNKFRTVMVIAAIVTLLSFTIAIAAGFSGFINIKGEPVDMPDVVMAQPTAGPPHLTATEEPEIDYFALVDNIILSAPAEYLAAARYVDGDSTHGSGRSIHVPVESYKQLAQLVGDDSLMLNIPEGWEFRPGNVTLACSEDSAYEVVSEETTPEGITVTLYRIPEGQAVVRSYSYNLRNAEGDLLGIMMDLSMTDAATLYHVSEEDTTESIALPGMEDALLIVRPDGPEAYARCSLAEPVGIWTDSPGSWERNRAIDTYDTATFNIHTWNGLVPGHLDENEFREVLQALFSK